jgi:hypothetical protein
LTARTRSWIAPAVLLVTGLALRAPGAARLPLNVDEPLYLVTAQVPERLLTLYRDTLFNKPLLAILYYKAALLSAHPLMALWVITTGMIIATALLLARTASTLAADERIGTLAGLLFYAFVNRAPNGVASAQLEHPINLLIAFAMYLVVVHDARRGWARIATVLAVVALALLKQYLVVFVVVVGLAARSWALLFLTGWVVVAAFAAHFALLTGSFGNLFVFSSRYYPPDPIAGATALVKFALKTAALVAGGWFLSGAWRRRLPATGAHLQGWISAHWVPLVFAGGGALTVLATKGWPPHLLILVPPVAVLTALALGTFARDTRITLPLIGALAGVYICYGILRTREWDNRSQWTFERVTEQDYNTAVHFAHAEGVRSVYTFPSPIPEFYLDAGVRPAGFDPENDHRSAIGGSDDLQQRVREGFERNRPDLCIEIAPRPGNDTFVDPRYARFVHELVAARGRPVASSGGVQVWDCRRAP